MPEWRRALAATRSSPRGPAMLRVVEAWKPARRPSLRWLTVLASLFLVAGCSGMNDLMSASSPPPPTQAGNNIGSGQVKVALILPMSGAGNAGVAAQSMRNAAELALAEFNNPDIQLLVKDDGGSAPGAQQAAQQSLDEGAEIVLGPLFALTVGPVGQVARARRLSLELSPGIRCRPHHQLRRKSGASLVRSARPGQRLRHRGRSGVQADGCGARRPHRRARALSAGQGADARADP